MNPHQWPPERIETLIRLWQDGYSASAVARELGGGLTRNAVIGKAERLRKQGFDVDRRQGPAPKKVKPPSKPARTAVQCRVSAAPTGHETGCTPPTAPPEPVVPISMLGPAPDAPTGASAAVLALAARQCRWPIGDTRHDDFRFCTRATSSAGQPYCEHHAKASRGKERRRESEDEKRVRLQLAQRARVRNAAERALG